MKAVLLIACILPVAACNRGPQVNEKNASVEEVAQKVRESTGDQAFVRPGLWESKVTIEKFDVPGMPPEMAQRMKTMMAENQEHGFQTCLTPEDVKKPKEDFFAGKNNNCRYEHFTMGGGKIDIAMVCRQEDMTQNMNVSGSYTPTSYSIDTAMTGTGGHEQGMSMKMHVDSNRVGECTGKDDD